MKTIRQKLIQLMRDERALQYAPIPPKSYEPLRQPIRQSSTAY